MSSPSTSFEAGTERAHARAARIRSSRSRAASLDSSTPGCRPCRELRGVRRSATRRR
jgi:hypothetical protein